jgi:hypothetical protein
MKQVFTAENRLNVYHIKNLLETKGITTIVKNDGLSSVVGDIPLESAWPEVWVTDPDMETYAKELIKQSKAPEESGEEWTCENCGEKHSAQFVDCWNCQSTKDIS